MRTHLDADPSGTSEVGVADPTCARSAGAAKERLSDATATALAGPHSTIRLTRAELEAVVRAPLDRFVQLLLDTLQRNDIAPGQLAAVATVGGGARIPLVTQRLSEALRMPVTTSWNAQVAAACGAELLAVRDAEHAAATALAPAYVPEETVAVAAAPLAWSAEDSDAADADVTEFAPAGYGQDIARPDVYFVGGDDEAAAGQPAAWYRRAPVFLAGAACVAAIAAAGVLLTAQVVRDDGAVTAGVSEIGTPVATHSIEAPTEAAASPAQVTQTGWRPPPHRSGPPSRCRRRRPRRARPSPSRPLRSRRPFPPRRPPHLHPRPLRRRRRRPGAAADSVAGVRVPDQDRACAVRRAHA